MDARTDPDTAAAAGAPLTLPPARTNRRRNLFMILGAVVVLAAVGVTLDWLLVGSHHETTDDAYVDADVADVTPQISGPIISDPASDTLPVKKGDVLVAIDPADFKLALAQAEAALGQAQRRVEGYFANRDAQGAMTVARAADVDHARAQLISSTVRLRESTDRPGAPSEPGRRQRRLRRRTDDRREPAARDRGGRGRRQGRAG